LIEDQDQKQDRKERKEGAKIRKGKYLKLTL